MNPIVIVSPHVAKWGEFIAVLGNQHRVDVIEAHSGAEAIAVVEKKKPVAVVIDQNLGDMAGTDLVLDLLQFNAMINVGLVSDLPEDIFHEETEGLGILMKLPPIPDGQAAVDFLERLSGVN